MGTSPFDYINSITQSKSNDILDGTLDPEEYNPFIVNRGLSLFEDTIFFAQEMNIRPDIPKESQYHFLHTLIPKRKRWSKWPKKELSKVDKIFFDILQDKYKYSLEKCIEINKLLDNHQKKAIIDLFTIPEVKKAKKNEHTK